jgi:sensor histidine kinase regulating citrate/malate metabolism
MKTKRNDKIIFLMTALLSVSFIVLAIFVIAEEFGHIDSVYENQILNTANIIADDETVKTKLKNEDFTLNDYVDKYYDNVEVLSLIIIMDMDNVRFTHPEENLLGEVCDQVEVSNIFSGETYLGTYSDSTDKISIRAFVPIYDGDTQIGVAILRSEITELKVAKTATILIGFGFGLIASLVSLTWITNRFKNDLFGYSPGEIGLMYAENKSIIEQLSESIISVDEKLIITTLNLPAQKMFNLTEKDVGKSVEDVVSFVDFKEIITNDRHITNKYRKIKDEKLLMNAFPLYLEDGKIIGATAIFRSHFEVDSLLDQIQGYQQMSVALRNQKHEFQNKLHVVLGLIKMKDYLKAENYIMENVYTTNLASDYYTSRIKDDRILALFIGKEIQSKGLNTQLLLTSDSFLTKSHKPINSDDIVLVLGNLVDNSFEAYLNSDIEEKRIVVDMFEDDDKIKITVIDHAGGIHPEVLDKMFERGISTKNGDSRGTGLSLVSEIVTVYNGEKNVFSTKKETKIEIILMKVII